MSVDVSRAIVFTQPSQQPTTQQNDGSFIADPGFVTMGFVRGSQLVETVRTLVQCNFHYRTAAELLFTHPNTLRYRMSRINELTGLYFADADDRLKVEIALRILDVIGPVPAAPA